MADPNILTRDFLLQDATLVLLLGGESVYGGVLPDGFDPTLGPAVVVCSEGGDSRLEAPVSTDRVKVRVWCGVNEYQLARQIYSRVWSLLRVASHADFGDDGFLITCTVATRGSDITDQDTGWATVVSFFNVTSRDSSGTPPAPVNTMATKRYSFLESPNGSRTTFTAVDSGNSPIALTFDALIFINGELLAPGFDYTYSGSVVTFLTIVPSSSDILQVLQSPSI